MRITNQHNFNFLFLDKSSENKSKNCETEFEFYILYGITRNTQLQQNTVRRQVQASTHYYYDGAVAAAQTHIDRDPEGHLGYGGVMEKPDDSYKQEGEKGETGCWRRD